MIAKVPRRVTLKQALVDSVPGRHQSNKIGNVRSVDHSIDLCFVCRRRWQEKAVEQRLWNNVIGRAKLLTVKGIEYGCPINLQQAVIYRHFDPTLQTENPEIYYAAKPDCQRYRA